MAETMGKLQRSALLHYLDAAPGSNTPEWFLIGKDVEDMSINLNPDTETKKNILDETSVEDNGYQPSADVDTYYANPSDGKFYTWLKDIAMNRKTGDDCKTQVLEVLIDKTSGSYDAWIEDAVIKPQSYGGAQGGVRVPYQIMFDGNRKQVSVTMENRKPTIATE